MGVNDRASQDKPRGRTSRTSGSDVRPVDDGAFFDGVTSHRMPGRHGRGEIAEGRGPVSGFVFDADETMYIAGDTI